MKQITISARLASCVSKRWNPLWGVLAGQAALAFTRHVRRAVWRRTVRGTDILAAIGLAAPLALGLIVLLWHK